MSIFPLKPKRSAGGAFLAVWIASGLVWIETNYQLNKPDDRMFSMWSQRDVLEWTRERAEFIARSEKFKIDGSVYIVVFNCDITHDMKTKIVTKYHKNETIKVMYDD